MNCGARLMPLNLSCSSESELVEMVQNGLEGALEELARRYREKIVRDVQGLFKGERTTGVEEILSGLLPADLLPAARRDSSLCGWACLLIINGFLLGIQ
ncbi:MAG: hypothetical protein AB1640_03025 [bacterium]